jgi:glycosyltransferase involved in cell wall biosynthesis
VTLYFFRLGNSEGGAERMLLRLADELVRRSHEVHVVSWDPPDAQAFHSLGPGVTWHKLGFADGWRDKIRRTFALRKLLAKVRPDVFVGFVMGADKTVYAGCALAGVPIVAAERNSPEMYDLKLGGLRKALYMSLFRLAKRIVVQVDDYRRGYPPALASRIEVIANPVAAARLQASPAESGPQGWCLLAVARLEAQKNLAALVEAFALLAPEFPDWCLRVVGEGSLRHELETQAESRGLAGRIAFPGAIKDIEAEYAGAHLFCLPSRWEGFPNALAEAMAHGLPAVGYAECPGVNAIIEDRVDGILAPGNGDPMSLAASLRILMADPERRQTMGRAARSLAGRFAPEVVFNEWEAVLHAAAGSHA